MLHSDIRDCTDCGSRIFPVNSYTILKADHKRVDEPGFFLLLHWIASFSPFKWHDTETPSFKYA